MRAYRDVATLREELAAKRGSIQTRLDHFRRVGRGDDRTLFEELCFCILAIQSTARGSDAAVRGLAQEGLLWSGDRRAVARYLHRRTRFHNHKADYIVRARERFFPGDLPALKATLDRFASSCDAREWLVSEVDGFGYKEASHFLRNIGRGEDLAILDRHILANLAHHGVIGRVPKSLTRRRYLAIEARARTFAETLGISLGTLDLLLWSRETGEIFK